MKKMGNVIVCLVLTVAFFVPVSAVNDELKDTTSIEVTPIDFAVQPTDVEWSKEYGSDEFDMLHCVHETDDGGYIACGVTTAEDLDNVLRPWVLKIAADGNEVWEWELTWMGYEGNYFNHFDDSYCTFVQQTNDGGYIVCVGLLCDTGMESYWVCGLAKLDESGGEEWVEHYAVWHEWSFHPRSLIELPEGGFMLTGLSGNYGIDEDYYACLLKTDSDGKEQWRKEYNYGDGDDQTWGICGTNDNGFLITGYALTETDGFDYWLIKTDADGNEEWSKTFGGYDTDFGHSRNCFQTDDGGYLMCGYSYSFGAGRADVWSVKTDSIGTMEWNKTYGGRSMDVCWSMESTDDGGYVLCVSKNITSISGNRDDIHLVKLTDDGHIEWIQEFGGTGTQIGMYITGTDDGGFMVSGRTGAYGSSSSDGLLVKFAPFENQRPNKPAQPSGPARGRPGTDYTFTTSATDSDGDQVSYRWDWGDGNFSEWLDTTEATYSWSAEDNYDVRVMARDEQGGESDWSDPLPFSTPLRHQMLLERIMEWVLQLFGITIP